ncbi:hypothetical protein [Massilia horti]|uniref:Lipoprotein n=1 Tax=Massilia horti TaxID=2562153 RepID=A0A4Y9SSR5_9BURK|nr:hypothetical protein [Massilia horti]TFW28379.1 hypothetical protein E4O92_21380 [Massilia horti]
MARFGTFLLAGLAAALGGCATLLDSSEQLVELHTILDNREVAGIGCVLANDAGRWFVVAPGRVTIVRSSTALTVDCARQGVGSSRELVDSRFSTGKLIGNLVVSGGLGYLVDWRTGAGFAYPATLTVIMKRPPAPEQVGALDNRVF